MGSASLPQIIDVLYIGKNNSDRARLISIFKYSSLVSFTHSKKRFQTVPSDFYLSSFYRGRGDSSTCKIKNKCISKGFLYPPPSMWELFFKGEFLWNKIGKRSKIVHASNIKYSDFWRHGPAHSLITSEEIPPAWVKDHNILRRLMSSWRAIKFRKPRHSQEPPLSNFSPPLTPWNFQISIILNFKLFSK